MLSKIGAINKMVQVVESIHN